MALVSKDGPSNDGKLGEKLDRFYEWFIPRYLVVVGTVTAIGIVGAGMFKLFHS